MGGPRGRRWDAVLAARCSGVAAAYAHVARLTRDEALVAISEILTEAGVRPGSDEAARILTEAAAMYTDPTGPGEARWYPAAAALLAEAGADLDRAVAVQAERRRKGGFTVD